MGQGMDRHGGNQRLDGSYIDASRFQQHFTERAAIKSLLQVALSVVNNFTNQRIAIGMRATGGNTNQDIAIADMLAVNDFFLKSGDIT